MIDQRRLPLEEVYVRCHTWEAVADSIRTMAVRGAPALGVAAGMGMALAARAALRASAGEPARFRASLQDAAKGLFETRPTAYNLPWALGEMECIWSRDDLTPEETTAEIERRAVEIYEDDLASCRAIGDHGAELIQGEEPVILTHCNAGALATAGYGTALGVIRSVHVRNPRLQVLADETRPLLQGARLTAWELMREGISGRADYRRHGRILHEPRTRDSRGGGSRPHHRQRRRSQQDRHLHRLGSGSRAWSALLRGRTVFHGRPFTGRWELHPHRGARRFGGHRVRGRALGSPGGAGSQPGLSTSHPPAMSPRSSPSGGWPYRPTRRALRDWRPRPDDVRSSRSRPTTAP